MAATEATFDYLCTTIQQLGVGTLSSLEPDAEAILAEAARRLGLDPADYEIRRTPGTVQLTVKS